MSGLVLLLAIVLVAPPGGEETVPQVVAEELAHFSPTEGAQVRVLARYSSQVGVRMELEGCEAKFIVPEEKRFQVLMDSKTRRGILEIHARANRSNGGSWEYRVEDIQGTPAADSLFAGLSARLDSTPSPRRRAVIGWALGLSTGEEQIEFREQVASRWADLATDELGRDQESAVAWLKIGHPHFEGDDRWIAYANQLAEKYGNERSVTSTFESLGLIESSKGWRPRSVFLHETGMIERDGERMTLDQSHLRDEIARWSERRQQASLLRGRSTPQYKELAGSHEVAEGMKREEVVLAWGYPHRVTWKREGNSFYEGWIYENREVYLIEGLVFFSQD